jgi:hypothetical protein
MLFAAPESMMENHCATMVVLQNGKSLNKSRSLRSGYQLMDSGKQKENVFNGLDKRTLTNYTQWPNGSPLNYTDWEVGEPKDFGSQHCGVFW